MYSNVCPKCFRGASVCFKPNDHIIKLCRDCICNVFSRRRWMLSTVQFQRACRYSISLGWLGTYPDRDHTQYMKDSEAHCPWQIQLYCLAKILVMCRKHGKSKYIRGCLYEPQPFHQSWGMDCVSMCESHSYDSYASCDLQCWQEDLFTRSKRCQIAHSSGESSANYKDKPDKHACQMFILKPNVPWTLHVLRMITFTLVDELSEVIHKHKTNAIQQMYVNDYSIYIYISYVYHVFI